MYTSIHHIYDNAYKFTGITIRNYYVYPVRALTTTPFHQTYKLGIKFYIKS